MSNNKMLCYGMTSHIPHTTDNVVFLDYDYTPIWRIEKIVKTLQKRYSLGTAYVAETGKNRYHVVFLDILNLHEWLQVIKDSKCHDGYRFHLNGQEYAILRLVKKGDNPAPYWVRTIQAKSIHRQSVVHGMILTKFWNLPERYLDFDNPTGIKSALWESVYYFTDNPRQQTPIQKPI